MPALEVGQLRAVLDSCKSNSFVDRRDNAIFRLLIDTGGRLREIAGLTIDDGDSDATNGKATSVTCEA